MFEDATAFDQDLGWCVDDDVNMAGAFGGSPCASTLCGILWGGCDIPSTGNVMVNWKIKQAVAAWLSDATAAEATYGHISTWETGGVTDMESLFQDASSFNEDISAWDTSGVTSMRYMFVNSDFNQDIGAWDTSGVTSMFRMFEFASSFNQDLGWCVDDDVFLDEAFYDAPCESTSCGVKQVAGGCAPTPAPTPGALGSDGATARPVALSLAVAGLVLLV